MHTVDRADLFGGRHGAKLNVSTGLSTFRARLVGAALPCLLVAKRRVFFVRLRDGTCSENFLHHRHEIAHLAQVLPSVGNAMLAICELTARPSLHNTVYLHTRGLRNQQVPKRIRHINCHHRSDSNLTTSCWHNPFNRLYHHFVLTTCCFPSADLPSRDMTSVTEILDSSNATMFRNMECP